MAKDAQKRQRRPVVLTAACTSCSRIYPVTELHYQRGVRVCYRKACTDEYNPRKKEV